MNKTVLSIETSCDETGIAVVEQVGSKEAPRFVVHKDVLTSQIEEHRPFGGVVPSVAKREHIKALPLLLTELIGEEEDFWERIDEIGVTVCPGLEPALWTGITFAQELAEKHSKPLRGVHHMRGHLYSTLLETEVLEKAPSETIGFPAIALVVSGGHTLLLRVDDLYTWEHLGETRDDAVGEAFDKVARLLELPYPGGPEIEKLAKEGKADAIDFPRPMLHEKNYDFSFSGLKTSVLYYLRDNEDARKADVAASFQEAAVDVLARKTTKAAEEYGAQSVMISGGVAASKALRARIVSECEKNGFTFVMPPMKYNTDNAAMIGAAALMASLNNEEGFPLEAQGRVRM